MLTNQKIFANFFIFICVRQKILNFLATTRGHDIPDFKISAYKIYLKHFHRINFLLLFSLSLERAIKHFLAF